MTEADGISSHEHLVKIPLENPTVAEIERALRILRQEGATDDAMVKITYPEGVLMADWAEDALGGKHD